MLYGPQEKWSLYIVGEHQRTGILIKEKNKNQANRETKQATIIALQKGRWGRED